MMTQSTLSSNSDIQDLPDNPNFLYVRLEKQQWYGGVFNQHGFIIGNGYIMMLQQMLHFVSRVARLLSKGKLSLLKEAS